MKGAQGRHLRRESAISLLEKQISAHEANSEFVTKILKDKNVIKVNPSNHELIEKIRKKKLERAKTCLENTKKNLHK